MIGVCLMLLSVHFLIEYFYFIITACHSKAVYRMAPLEGKEAADAAEDEAKVEYSMLRFSRYSVEVCTDGSQLVMCLLLMCSC